MYTCKSNLKIDVDRWSQFQSRCIEVEPISKQMYSGGSNFKLDVQRWIQFQSRCIEVEAISKQIYRGGSNFKVEVNFKVNLGEWSQLQSSFVEIEPTLKDTCRLMPILVYFAEVEPISKQMYTGKANFKLIQTGGANFRVDVQRWSQSQSNFVGEEPILKYTCRLMPVLVYFVGLEPISKQMYTGRASFKIDVDRWSHF